MKGDVPAIRTPIGTFPIRPSQFLAAQLGVALGLFVVLALGVAHDLDGLAVAAAVALLGVALSGLWVEIEF